MADITYKRTGFGQVEPNHLSAQRNGQIYAQLPAHTKNGETDIVPTIDILENGQFVKYDYAKGEVNFTGAGEWMMVFNEVKLYDTWRETYKDFAMIRDNYTAGSDYTHEGIGPFKGQMTPRVIKTMPGDIWTTNALKVGNTSGKAVVATGCDIDEDLTTTPVTLGINSKGFLDPDGDKTDIEVQVVKHTTMPDGTPAVKLMRIK